MTIWTKSWRSTRCVAVQITEGWSVFDNLIVAIAAINESRKAITNTGRRDPFMSMSASQKFMSEKRPNITVMMDRERLISPMHRTMKSPKSRENVYPA
jgi:hypothetical protein